ncbi:MAG TPA: dihydrodipicolinate synthase family protein [Candidatus Binataceae bacterium]|nr:dihydrodipicolinate synthase family protein [Candidatus Binataceae bacterium]
MEKPLSVRGVIPSIITPFRSDLEIDEAGLRRYAKHISTIPGVTGLLCAAYTGEVDSLTDEEKVRVIELCRTEVSDGIKVYGCVDAHSTRQAISEGRAMKEAGADAVQINSPFLNPHRRGYLATPDASVKFFRALNDEVGLPMTVFQYPESSGMSYSTRTLVELADIHNVVGIKQAGGIDDYIEYHSALGGKVASIADNNGYTLLAMLLWGADATMVGASNVGTALYCELFAAAQAGQIPRAVELMNTKLIKLLSTFTRNLGQTTSSFITRMKEALVMQGLIDLPAVRAPEPAATDEEREGIRRVLKEVGLI